MKKEKIYQLLFGLVFIIGICLRVLFYFYNRPFWNDEAALAINIVNSNNYFETLMYNQCAPALFMYVSKLFYMLLPLKEFALRLLPLLSSILSLFAFCYLGSKFFVKKSSLLISFAIFTFCYPICYYAQEFKQYSSDVLCFLTLLCSYFILDKIKSKKYIFTLLCALSLWFSYSAGFALFAILITAFIFKHETLKNYYIPSIPIIISLILFILFTKNIQTHEYLHTYWANGFINKDFSNFMQIISNNIFYIFNSILPVFLLAVSCAVWILKERKNDLYLLLSFPFITSLVLSYLSIYPFCKRVSLFLIPILIMLSIKPFDYINIKNKVINNFIITAITIIILTPILALCANNIIHKQYVSEDIITPLKIALQNAKPKDIIYIADSSGIIFEYYKNQFQISNRIIIDDKHYSDEKEYENHLSNLPANTTYYWIFAHHKNKFNRLKTVYNWAKNKEDFTIYSDTKGNALIRFKS